MCFRVLKSDDSETKEYYVTRELGVESLGSAYADYVMAELGVRVPSKCVCNIVYILILSIMKNIFFINVCKHKYK